MGTWICHLRIAEKLLPHLPELDKVLFTFGNLAPDSGIPNKDWTEFDPPKEVTHYLQKGEGEWMIRDLDYYREHLAALNPRDDLSAYSFRLGYFIHLFCDIMWSKYIHHTTVKAFAELIAQDGDKAWGVIKKDWYGLDQVYNQAHKEGLFWRIIHPTPNPPSHLPFIKESALHRQYDYIRKFYGEYDPYWFEERKYPYLNESAMNRIVDDTTRAALFILGKIGETDFERLQSTTQILPPEMTLPYEMPLGDL